MSVLSALLLVTLVTCACARPPAPIGYFPSNPHPWATEPNSKSDDYISSYKERFQGLEGKKEKSRPKFALYSKAEDGFVPSDLKTLNDVYWWKKRYNNLSDAPFLGDDTDEGVVKKRDYTAAQWVNRLKALARARRIKQMRVVDKSMRFGISK